MKKEIEMALPKVAHAPANTYLLSLLLPHKEAWGWIASNFLNISLHKKDYWDEFYRYDMWGGCPYILETSITREVMEAITNDFVRFACKMIDLGHCIYVSINRYPVKISNAKETSSCHNPFIYDYDNEKQVFLVAEFHPGKVYSFKEIPFEQIEKAYLMYPLVSENYPHKKIRLIKFYNDGMFQFSKKDLASKFEEYISSENLYVKFHQGFYRSGFLMDSTYSNQFDFGLSYYDVLTQMVLEVEPERTVNYRPFQLLVFKDSINEFRIDYLKKQDYEVSCGESFKLLQSKSAVLRNMILKGNIAGYRDKESIVNFISETRQADKVFCDLIIKDLRG